MTPRHLTQPCEDARLGGVPLLGLLEIIAISGGGVLAAIFGWLSISRNAAVKKAAEARAREEAITGSLARTEAHRTAGDIITRKSEDERRLRAEVDARLEAERRAAVARGDAEAARTAAAVAKGDKALAERANQAIDEGKLAKGRPQ